MKNYFSVDQYLEQFPLETKIVLQNLRNFIFKLIPEAEEVISYGIPTYKIHGKNLVHFGGYKSHVGFYPGPEAIKVFKNDLNDYKTSKGAIQFDLDKPLPFETIKEIVRFRIKKLQI